MTDSNPFNHPLAVWMQLGTRTHEMLLASVAVIGHRTARMVGAAPVPSADDQREFVLMGQEKIEAASAAAQAMAVNLIAGHPELGIHAFSQMMTGVNDWISLGASRTTDELIERQAKLIQTMTQAALSTTQLTVSAARVAEAGLSPIHARATANARRLGGASAGRAEPGAFKTQC